MMSKNQTIRKTIPGFYENTPFYQGMSDLERKSPNSRNSRFSLFQDFPVLPDTWCFSLATDNTTKKYTYNNKITTTPPKSNTLTFPHL